VVGSCDLPGFAYDVCVAANRAYLAAGDGGLQIVDVGNPRLPKAMGYWAQAYAQGVDVWSNTVYLAAAEKGLVMLDASDGASPRAIGMSERPRQARRVVRAGGLVFVADTETGLWVFECPIAKPEAGRSAR
ncbi:MAG: hypothetical protein N3D11_13055, partial [Candidatus Sumerlaeia bacterium]|nr:hypothetical protein [Candidatus Sumerlaeia bacterium]